MLIFISLITSLFQSVKLHGEVPEQELQNINIKLIPEIDITSQTNLSILVTNKNGHNVEFNRNDQISISKEFNKMFTYSPWNKKVNIKLKNFLVYQKLYGHFIIYCNFEAEIDEDTHWEILWMTPDGVDLPMTTFFVKANLPTVMEVLCKEVFSTDCNSLVENDDAIIICVIKMGMPFLNAYLDIPVEALPVVLSKTPRRIEARIKLMKASYYKSLTCGSNGENFTTSRPFEFILLPEHAKLVKSGSATFIVFFFTIITLCCAVLGIYVILVKPSKERSKEKVIHHVEISSEVKKSPMSLSGAESRRSMNIKIGSNIDY